jgi:WD40 repeat protein
MIVLQGARERVEVLQFSPDGRALAAPCPAGVQLWSELAAGRSPTAVLPHAYIGSVRFTPDGSKLLLDGFPARSVVHELPTGKAVEIPLQLRGGGGSCELSPDGRFIVVGQTHTRMRPPGLLFCVAVDDPASLAWSVTSPRWLSSRPLFLGGGERFAVLEFLYQRSPADWRHVHVTRDIRTGAVVAEVPAKDEPFDGPVLSADRRWVAGRRRAWAAVYRADDLGADPVQFRNDNRKEFTGLAFHPSGRYLAATSNDATVKLYDTATWKVVRSFNWDIGRLRSVAFSPDGMLAAAGGDRGKVVVWDVDL